MPMSDTSQKTRLIRILEILSSGKPVSVKELKKQFFTVSERTLQRDIQEIAEILPLEDQHIRGREKAWRILPDYRRMITPVVHRNELLAFHFLKIFIKSMRSSCIAEDIQNLEKKLELLAPGEVVYPSEFLDDELFYNQNPGYYDYSEYDTILEKIIAATTEKQWLDVDYFPVEAAKARTFQVFPHRIYTYSGSLYLLATFRFHKEPGSLLVHFIQKAETSEPQPKEKPAFSKSDFTLTRFGVFLGKPEVVELHITQEVKRYFVGRVWHESQQVTENSNGTLNLKLEVPLMPDFIGWIFTWGRHVRVISPPALIEKIRDEAKAVLENYPPDVD